MSDTEAAGSSGDAEAEADSPSILDALDEDGLVEVLHAAKAVGALSHLASTSKQVCSTTRGRVPVHLQVRSKEQAELVIKSQALSGRIFSACTQLTVAVEDMTGCCMAGGVMGAAQQWPALQQLQMWVPSWAQLGEHEERLGVHPDTLTCSMLSMAPALRNLRQLELFVPAFGRCSAGVVGQMVQLTSLSLYVVDAPPADLQALSCLSNLREFKADVLEYHDVLHVAPGTLPAAGPAGPWCLPSSLTRLELTTWDDEDTPYIMAYWLTHLPGCPQLQHLDLGYGTCQHASAHPSVVVPLLAQHNPRLRHLKLVSSLGPENEWVSEAPGLPYAAVPDEEEVFSGRPSTALAALKSLEHLEVDMWVGIASHADWQHLAQLSALTALVDAVVCCAPGQSVATPPRLLRLSSCCVCLGGYDLGLLLQACPLLQEANMYVRTPESAAPWQPAQVQTPLRPHPSLQRVSLLCLCEWDEATQAAEYAALAPVLQNVPSVRLHNWHIGDDAAAAYANVKLC